MSALFLDGKELWRHLMYHSVDFIRFSVFWHHISLIKVSVSLSVASPITRHKVLSSRWRYLKSGKMEHIEPWMKEISEWANGIIEVNAIWKSEGVVRRFKTAQYIYRVAQNNVYTLWHEKYYSIIVTTVFIQRQNWYEGCPWILDSM
jgi:hypothetical protein